MTKNHEYGSWARANTAHAQELTQCIVQLAVLAGPEHADTVSKHLREPLPEPGALTAQKEHWVRNGRKGHSL